MPYSAYRRCCLSFAFAASSSGVCTENRVDDGGRFRGGRHLDRRRRPQRLTVRGDGDRPLHDVVHVEQQPAILAGRQQLEQVHDVGAVQLRGVRGHPAGQIGVADDRHPVVRDDLLARHGRLAVAAAGRGQVHDDAARLHVVDHLGGDGPRRLTPHQRGRHDDVGLGRLLRIDLSGSRGLVLGEFLRVAVGRDLLDAAAGRDERRAHRLDLLGDLRAHVERPDVGAEAACRADGGQPGNPGADDEDGGGLRLPGRGDLPAEHPAVGLGGLDHAAVPGDVGHGRQHVHRLRPGDPRNRVQGQSGCPPRVQRGEELRLITEPDAGDDGRALPQSSDLVEIRLVHLHDDVARPDLVRRRDGRTRGLVGLVGELRVGARTRLDQHLVTEGDQLRGRLGCRRDNCLPGPTLRRYSYTHGRLCPSDSIPLGARDQPDGRLRASDGH